MSYKTLLFIFLILILIYIVFRYVYSDVTTLSSTLNDGTSMITIPASSLAGSSSGVIATNYTYSIWYYIEDWNLNYGNPKILFANMNSAAGTPDLSTLASINALNPSPALVFGPTSNDLYVSLTVFPGVDTVPATASSIAPTVQTFTVPNMPIQKWTNVLISVYGRTLDVYVDGKLTQTGILSGVADVNNTQPVYVTPNGGFSGWTANFKYWPNATDPQTAWNIYQSGYGASWLSSIFGQYTINLSLMNGSQVQSSISL